MKREERYKDVTTYYELWNLQSKIENYWSKWKVENQGIKYGFMDEKDK